MQTGDSNQRRCHPCGFLRRPDRLVRQCWKFIEQSVEQTHVEAIRARLYQRHDIHLSREPLEDAARVEPLYCCVPFREQSGAARMQVETTALPGSVAVALPHQLLGSGIDNSTASANPRRRCKNICRTAASSHSNRVLGAWQRRPKSSSGRTGANTFLQLRSVAPNRLISYYTNTYD